MRRPIRRCGDDGVFADAPTLEPPMVWRHYFEEPGVLQQSGCALNLLP